MTIIRPPIAVSREGGQRLYLKAADSFLEEMNRANDWALSNYALGKHSELKKPYMMDGYQEMENFSAQDYSNSSNWAMFDWEKWLQEKLAAYRAGIGALSYKYNMEFTIPSGGMAPGTSDSFLVDVTPFNVATKWEWSVNVSDINIDITKIVPIVGMPGNHMVEVFIDIGSDASNDFTVVAEAKSQNSIVKDIKTIEIGAGAFEDMSEWNDDFSGDLSKWETPSVSNATLGIVSGELTHESTAAGYGASEIASKGKATQNFDVQFKTVGVFADWTSAGLWVINGGNYVLLTRVAYPEPDGHQIQSVQSGGSPDTATITNGTVWLRIIREGALVTTKYSTNGSTWTTLGEHAVDLQDSIEFKLAFEDVVESGSISVDDYQFNN